MNVIPLLERLSDGQFHSGQALGESLSVSRSAIWKQINRLRDIGVDVHSVTGHGYRIPGGLSLLDRGRLLAELGSTHQWLDDALDIRFTVDSTNLEAMRRIRDGANRYLLFAEHQSAGRGRRGRQWISPLGHNIYMSLLWRFQSGIAALEGLSLVVALSVLQALSRFSLSGLAVKWPNDVLVNGRKLAGILLELQGDVDGPCHVVMGVGVNTRIPEAAGAAIDQPYSDMSAVSGAPVDRNDVAIALIDSLAQNVERFERDGFTPFRQQWLEHDAYLGRRVEVRSGDHVSTGIVAGIDDNGRLLLDEQGRISPVFGGELFPSVRPV